MRRYYCAMEYPLSHISAALYWTAYGAPYVPKAVRMPTDVGMFTPARMRTVEQAESLDVLDEFDVLDRDGRIHILAANGKNRIWKNRTVCHCCSQALPSRCFLMTECGLPVVSPGLSFVQMGSVLSVSQLARYGMALCGVHAITPQAVMDEHQGTTPLPRRSCIASVDDLALAVDEFSFIKGAGRAKMALRHIAERSRSPMETAAALLLSLPRHMGGYGMPRPRMNQVLYSNDAVGARNGLIVDDAGRAIEFDLVFERASRIAVVEYAGSDYHRSDFSLYRDSIRSNAVNSANMLQLSLTKRQLYDKDAFHLLALQLGKHLGVRFRPASDAFFQKALLLRRDILRNPWGALK